MCVFRLIACNEDRTVFEKEPTMFRLMRSSVPSFVRPAHGFSSDLCHFRRLSGLSSDLPTLFSDHCCAIVFSVAKHLPTLFLQACDLSVGRSAFLAILFLSQTLSLVPSCCMHFSSTVIVVFTFLFSRKFLERWKTASWVAKKSTT